MIAKNIILLVSNVLLVICSFFIITLNHTIFCVLYLALSFISAAFVLFLLECEFLALLFLVIYLGAILVLFLFATLMLEFKLSNLRDKKSKRFLVGIFFSIVILSCSVIHISRAYCLPEFNLNCFYMNAYQNWYHLTDCSKDVQVYGQVLYSYYVLQFLVSGLILMSVLISVVYLTNKYSIKHSKTQCIFKQLSKSFLLFKHN